MTMEILVVAETREHGLHPVSIEAIVAASRFGGRDERRVMFPEPPGRRASETEALGPPDRPSWRELRKIHTVNSRVPLAVVL